MCIQTGGAQLCSKAPSSGTSCVSINIGRFFLNSGSQRIIQAAQQLPVLYSDGKFHPGLSHTQILYQRNDVSYR